ncbi:MAG: TraB/GumN family protein [Verrucomicrobiaceae bacterium]|nr:TraB/GumN family protein [Verrucomicrobiaceae bacterium]
MPWIICLPLLLVLTGCEPSSPKAEAVVPDAVLAPEDGAGSVWVVKSANGKNKLYLCGTIHILREEDYPLAPAYEAAYLDSQMLLLELPPGSGSSTDLVSRMSSLATYSNDTALDRHIDEKSWAAVKAWAATRNLDPSSLNRFRPWYVALMITAVEYAALGAKPDQGVDNYFEALAAQDKKPAEGLETVEFQLQMFAGLTDHQQQELLSQTLEEVKNLSGEFNKMIRAWKDGDLDTLHGMLFREAEKFPELMDLFLNNRNRNWITRLEQELLTGKNIMVLVGTGHFAGEKGLVNLFRSKGYDVTHYQGHESETPPH